MNQNFSYNEINQILVEKLSKFLVDERHNSTEVNTAMVLSISKNIEDLGFVFSKELFEALTHQTQENLVDTYNNLILTLTNMLGAHVKHEPFYKNFPQEVASLSDLELFMNALVHYWSDGQWLPEYVDQLRFPLEGGGIQARTISLGSFADFDQVFIEMMSGKGSLSRHDQELLSWYIQKSTSEDLLVLLPDPIPTKETLSLVLSNILIFHPNNHALVNKYIKTATDILRLVTSWSGGDTSLASNTRFINFSRSERRLVLSLLESCKGIEEDIGRYPEKWIRVGEKLHPGDYSAQFPVSYEAFRKVRNGEVLYSFAAEVEKCLRDGNYQGTLSLLERRPGELARRLDFLARRFPEQNADLIDTFMNVSGQISSLVLLQLMAHFKSRNKDFTTRSFFPKGNVSKVKVVETPLPPLSDAFCSQIVTICEQALIQQFKDKPPLGKVWINPVLKEIYVPIAQRASSRSLKTYARGSRFPLPEEVNTLRGFIHWKNVTIETTSQISTDVDLSLGLYDSEWNFVKYISYTNLRSRKLGLYHSGDIVDAPQGASEFIDMDIEALRRNGIRYAVFSVYSYSQHGYDEIPECFFGWMNREKPDSGEIFEPKTVSNKIDLTSPSLICLPVLFDFEEQMAIWMDVALNSNPNWVNNIEANSNNVVLISKAITELKKPNLFDLFTLNVIARGELIETPEGADHIFGIDETDDVTPFQVETILSDFL